MRACDDSSARRHRSRARDLRYRVGGEAQRRRRTQHAACRRRDDGDAQRPAERGRTAECENSSPHLPAGARSSLDLQGLELAYDFPQPRADRHAARAATELHPIYTALFRAIRELGWNDLLYETEGAACFRGTHTRAVFKLTIGGTKVTVNAFNNHRMRRPSRRLNTNAHRRHSAPRRSRPPDGTHHVAARPGGGHRLQRRREPAGHRGAAVWQHGPPHRRHLRGVSLPASAPASTRPNPMHFKVPPDAVAPAAANAGSLGPVVPTRLLPPDPSDTRHRLTRQEGRKPSRPDWGNNGQRQNVEPAGRSHHCALRGNIAAG